MIPLCIISGLGLLIYSNTFHFPFHFDDSYFIVNNPVIRNIHHLQDIWDFMPCRFVTFLSIALNYHFGQLNVFGYHLVNLLVHLASGILVWWLVRLTLSTPAMKEDKIARHADAIALLAGLVFISHPLQTEAVTYIWQRSASMATMFYLASLGLYVKSRLLQAQKPGSAHAGFYYGSLIMAVMAMFTKETAITLPLMIMLYEFSFFKGPKKFDRKELVPFLCLLLIIPLTILFKGADQEKPPADHISSMHYFLTQLRVMVTYVRLVFWPYGQNLDYDYPVYKSLFEGPVFASVLFLTAVFFAVKQLFSKYRLVFFSICWFFLTLLPESSFLPLKDVIFEHRLYLPLVGYSLFLVSSSYYLLGKDSFKMMAVTLLMIIACYSALTYQRNKVWRDDITLWSDVVKKSPHKERPYLVRSDAYIDQGNIVEALFGYNEAIKVNPGFALAYNNRGSLYYRQGNFVQAISDFDKSIEAGPNEKAYYNRAVIYGKQGRTAEAMSDYDKAIEIKPDYAEAYNNRGLIYYNQGKSTEAMADYSKAIEIKSDYAEAYYNRGLIYYNEGRNAEAIDDYSKAIEIKPDFALAYNNRGLIYYNQGKDEEAIADYNKAIELDPSCALAYANRSAAYTRKDK